jgi:hypothetical protein
MYQGFKVLEMGLETAVFHPLGTKLCVINIAAGITSIHHHDYPSEHPVTTIMK